ncbi:UDP-N-acetylmuramate dehydrogenase [Chimaeribacter arupi]|uniref:UDP-N-acetylenolpyruvoylglucosamine reductase n=2 Tax=Yersiniaceae TaxID=1903411 RepID=A0A2N5EH68_9GAMM|nr:MULTISPECIES: UDP-N-acetylmuramate dehydrogenase [Yersiniaceae]MBS0971690.1 UDP-N-acetylmuramate dehydrogenase [Nissabacter archeti]PLR29110.1 UDP-N-acetylmuramate dehydrogenase [Chimaeribacter arupi]PLR41878.1 UDP-N-acetylmuramate dehydrogenase [Chimaeribacter arupi]PLR42088.1 UDP-N-acetylmuramate dehydrogenase [Chimaeribacter arupi]PLR42761.1 UDP-N-acetylmuramate dehydrogenase [Chimaeribacter arupi]
MPNPQISLKSCNTFHIDAKAQNIINADSVEKLLSAWQAATSIQQDILLMGEGSNMLFLEDFDGTIILNRIKGISCSETSTHWLLEVGAGENWHQLVCHTLEQGIKGLENLALIPGCVGSAPIQNIGAYGIELKNVCNYVDIINLHTGEMTRLNREECLFGYRESIFKHQYREGYAITAVGFILPKAWQPTLSYGDLRNLNASTATAQDVFEAVCHMRRSKLPDPEVTGNAGSFFKNPIVSQAILEKIQQEFPEVPAYPQANGETKLAAGWLIDKCGLKGHAQGQAAVHAQQALVLINRGQASGDEIRALAKYVRETVAARFDIWLEPEVRFIAAHGEVNAVEALS